MADKRIPLQVRDLTGDIQTLSGYVVALRSGLFETNTIVGTEASEQRGYYDFTGIEINVRYQLWAGVTAETMTMNTAFSDDNGTVIFGVDESFMLDPADYEDNEIIVKTTIDGVESFIPMSAVDLLNELEYASSASYYIRGYLCQENTIQSGKAFFGGIVINDEDGSLIGAYSSVYTGAKVVNACSRLLRSSSAKISTGVYSLQCQVTSDGVNYTNGFINTVDGTTHAYKWEPYVRPVYGDYTVSPQYNYPTRTIGYIMRTSSTRVRIQVDGIGALYNATFGAFTEINIQNLICDILPTPNGIYTITALVDGLGGYLEIACNSDSGTATQVHPESGGFYPIGSEVTSYLDSYNPVLKGWIVLDTQFDPLTYYGSGKLLVKTYNTSWVLTDNIIDRGFYVDFRFPILA